MRIIKDLVPDLTHLFAQYEMIELEDSARYHLDDIASDRSLPSHRAWPTGRD
jgi:succinate dehydrogenase/fumarate reductase-like Fe-S protein